MAIDLGVKTGLAVYNSNGDLIQYHSRNYGNARRLKKAIHHILKEPENLKFLYIEGGGKLDKYWVKQAAKLGVTTKQIHAETWRNKLFPKSQADYHSKPVKNYAEKQAKEILKAHAFPIPENLNKDVSEAILIGLYGCIEQGWI
ncbi:MAG: hypothetical protein ACOCQ6_01935 [Bacteroidota bacterium]